MGEPAKVGNLVSRKTSQVEYLKDTGSKQVSVTSTSQDLETIYGEALPDYVAAITLVIDSSDTVNYSPSGAADANNAALPDIYTVWGNKDLLNTVELYSSAGASIGMIIHEANDEYLEEAP